MMDNTTQTTKRKCVHGKLMSKVCAQCENCENIRPLQTAGKDILGIRDEGKGWCVISVNSEEYKSDYSHAIRTLEKMIKKLQKWEERESS